MPHELHTKARTDVPWRARRSGQVPAPGRPPIPSLGPCTLECPCSRSSLYGNAGPPVRHARAHARRDSPHTLFPAPADRPGMAAARPRRPAEQLRPKAAPYGPRSAHGAAPARSGPARRGSLRGDSAPRLRPGEPRRAPRRGGAELGFNEKKTNQTVFGASLL